MKKSTKILLLVISALIILVLGFLAGRSVGRSSCAIASFDSASVVKSENPSYFSDTASIMFFYSDSCGWCSKQKEVLQELAKEGYKVKPMNVGKNPDLWEIYKIEGTPTFIAKNGEGERLVGFHEKEALKEWLDKNK